MESTVIILVIATVGALLVANRASKLNRIPFLWGIIAWLISPLLVWVILEIAGKKKKTLFDEQVEPVEETKAIQVAGEYDHG